MGLKLQSVAARQGWLWARDGMRLYLRRPVAFSAMLLLFLVATGVWSVLPVIGLAALASLPLLSLGFHGGVALGAARRARASGAVRRAADRRRPRGAAACWCCAACTAWAHSPW
jgi:hypothetical protein